MIRQAQLVAAYVSIYQSVSPSFNRVCGPNLHAAHARAHTQTQTHTQHTRTHTHTTRTHTYTHTIHPCSIPFICLCVCVCVQGLSVISPSKVLPQSNAGGILLQTIAGNTVVQLPMPESHGSKEGGGSGSVGVVSESAGALVDLVHSPRVRAQDKSPAKQEIEAGTSQLKATGLHAATTAAPGMLDHRGTIQVHPSQRVSVCVCMCVSVCV